MSDGTTPGAAAEDENESAAEMLGKLLGGSAGDLDEIAEASAPPVHWPDLDADDYADEFVKLYAWTMALQHRFREMVRLPLCWYRHNGIVELLGALRDHERASYSETSAPGAALSWQMAFRDAEARLRTWLADLRCGGDPAYHDPSVHRATVPDTALTDDAVAWVEEVQAIRPSLLGD